MELKNEVEQYLKDTYDESNEFQVRKPIICNDGFRISVQGGTYYHYCNPREKCNEYYEVECGFPSEKEDLIMEYAESPENPTETVYAYVPIRVIEDVIKKHGGIKNG